MEARELIALYRSLEAPTMEELRGEYRATILDLGSRAGDVFGRCLVNLPGRWWGKAFRPTGANEGEGYNRFHRFGRIVRKLRMRTFVGPSRIAEGMAYHLDYSAFLSPPHPIATMWDELRKLDDAHYLGLGRLGFTARQRRFLMPFLLEGPPEPFVGIGSSRS